MATLPRIKLQHRLPVLPGVCYCYSSTPSVTSFSSVNSVSGFSKKCEGGFKASRRLVVGLGAAFWAQFMNMAGNVGANSFIASARQKGAVEQVYVFLNFTAASHLLACFCIFVKMLNCDIWLVCYLGDIYCDGIEFWNCSQILYCALCNPTKFRSLDFDNCHTNNNK